LNTTALANFLRWIGRLTTVIVIAFVLVAATVPAGRPSFREVVGLVFFPGVVLVGLLLAWWREVVGAAVATAGLLAFYAWSSVSGAHFARGPWFVVCWSPTVFFAGSWLLRRHRSAPYSS
jgi:hypothetical protein